MICECAQEPIRYRRRHGAKILNEMMVRKFMVVIWKSWYGSMNALRVLGWIPHCVDLGHLQRLQNDANSQALGFDIDATLRLTAYDNHSGNVSDFGVI
jgi:hypothetical protein